MHYSYSIFVFITISYTYPKWTRIFIRPQALKIMGNDEH